MSLDNLKDIINSKDIHPTIVNESSNFVIVTYWWGRGVYNQNTSRPCIAFFEDFIKQIQKLCIKTLGTASPQINIQQIYNKLEVIIQNLDQFKNIINNNAKSYNEMIFEQLGVLPTDAERDNIALQKLEKMKATNKTPAHYEYKNTEYVKQLFTIIIIEIIKLIKSRLLMIFDTNNKIKTLRESFKSKQDLINPAEKEDILKTIAELNKILKEQNTLIKKKLNTKQNYVSDSESDNSTDLKAFNGMSIFEIFHKEFRFSNPMTYDNMILKWQKECEKFNCNHMAIEYPEFTLPGGYQMAINAKPLFIKKALEVTEHRSVLYIDGDMFIRKYPKLFDLTDVDFMARGWWMDPRSSYKMQDSITYDPYTFDTSGGTMFFSQSIEAKGLINKWVEISAKPYQIGKADDRILSLVFNTYKFLCSMKIIQLPIEYLWLTLDYDERMMDLVYDYDKYKMTETIIIEHSECLTSEDTATGSGAASDRTPKFYGYLEENLEPVSEEFHEYIMFPSLDMVDTFKAYLDYMAGVQYLNDGNDILYKKGLASLENPESNEQPLYITKYADRFGKNKYPQDNSLTYNDVAEINMKRAQQMNVNDLSLVRNGADNVIEINDFSKLLKGDNPGTYNHAKIMSLIIKLLIEGNTVIYNPTSMDGYNKSLYDLLIENERTKYKSMELIFSPVFTSEYSQSANYFYKPIIQTNQAIMFKPSEILIKFLLMFLSLDDFSSYLNHGSYEFMSRVRVGYVIKKTQRNVVESNNVGPNGVVPDMITPTTVGPGPGADMVGGNITNKDVNLYEEGINILYKGGRKRRYNNKRNVKKTVRKHKVKRITIKKRPRRSKTHRGKTHRGKTHRRRLYKSRKL
jgi:hypothetical protein